MSMTAQQAQNRAMRREQVERYLATDMTIKEWCELNRVAESTMYRWMSVFRREEPDLFAEPTCGDWVELSRESIAARTALAVRPKDEMPEEAPEVCGIAGRSDGHARADAAANALVVRIGRADVVVPEGASESHLAMVLRAVASL